MSNKAQLIELMKKKLYADNPSIATADVAYGGLVNGLLGKFVDFAKIITPVLGKDYYTEADQAMIYSSLYGALRASVKDGTDGQNGKDGDKGDRGSTGPCGADGVTPVRGVDYFTAEDVVNITRLVLDQIPKPETPDILGAIAPHLEEFKKNLPNNDSILVSILKDPRLRMLLHGGGSSAASSAATIFTQTPTGLIDGANKAYTVLNAITTVIGIWINGEFIHPSEYTAAGAGFTMGTALDASLSGKSFTISYT